MKCNFYSIIDPFKSGPVGGGELTSRTIIDHLKNCGFTVEIITPDTPFVAPEFGNLSVYADIWNDPQGSVGWFSGDQYTKLLNTQTPFLISEGAYTACTTNPYGMTEDYDEDLSRFSRHFFMKAKRVILCSPLHQREVEKFINYKLNNAHLYLINVDTKLFSNMSLEERDIPHLHIGSFNYWKGTDRVIKEYEEKGLVIGGYGKLPANKKVKFLGEVKREDLPELYNRAQNFVHLPRWKESYSRTVAEAALCGCNIITNDNVGITSWNYDLSDPTIYDQANEDFKAMIMDIKNALQPQRSISR